MRMLRWMMGIKRIENIRNEDIKARAHVANISENIREAIIRWLGHVERNENMEDGSGWTPTYRKTKLM